MTAPATATAPTFYEFCATLIGKEVRAIEARFDATYEYLAGPMPNRASCEVVAYINALRDGASDDDAYDAALSLTTTQLHDLVTWVQPREENGTEEPAVTPAGKDSEPSD